MHKASKIFIAGHKGLVGSAILRRCVAEGYTNLIVRNRSELDLSRQAEVERFFELESPEVVILAAARVGGILANSTQPADFIRDNLLVETNVIDAAYWSGTKRFVFLGSSCIYPKHAPQPLREEHLLTGALEPTNDAYAVAKIAGIKMCQAYQRQHGFDAWSLMPTNLYGPGDNFDLNSSHVLPALIRKFHEAKQRGDDCVNIWGSGEPRREFLHVDDLAEACLFVLRQPERHLEAVAPDRILNVGTGEDLKIKELAALISEVVGGQLQLEFDRTKPDGTPRKLLDTSRINSLGWKPAISLNAGITSTYDWFVRSCTQNAVAAQSVPQRVWLAPSRSTLASVESHPLPRGGSDSLTHNLTLTGKG
jgi:GDP-L-fucose synthase